MISLRTLSNSRAIVPALILSLACAPSLGAGSSPQGGSIDVSTEPAGAAVFLDGQPMGTTPVSIGDVSAGEHRVRVQKDGFLENSRVVSVATGRREAVALRMTQDPAPLPQAADTGEGWSTKKKVLVGAGAAAALLGIILIAGGGDDEPDNAAPVAGSIGVSPAGSGLAGITNYSFSAQGASDPDNAPLTYSWNFGDGGTGSGPNASHVFNNGGTFNVILTVSDGTLSSTTNTSVRVGDMNGTWVNIDPEPGFPGGIERRIRFDQSGTTLTGTYRISVAPGLTGSVNGRLSPPRNITFEAKLQDAMSQQVGFTFIGTVREDLTAFSGNGQGYHLRNDPMLFGREE